MIRTPLERAERAVIKTAVEYVKAVHANVEAIGDPVKAERAMSRCAKAQFAMERAVMRLQRACAKGPQWRRG